MIGDAALPTGSSLGLELVDEIDGGEEASPRSGSDAIACDGDGKMGLASSRSADQHGIALLGEEGAPEARSRTRASLIGVSLKAKSSTSLASGRRATVS